MAYEYDRLEREDGGGSFLMGLLAGTVLGAGLGMLFAPKAGSDLRNQLSEQAVRLRSAAGDTYQQASEKVNQASDKVSQIVDRGREAYDRARGAASNAASNVSSTVQSTGTTGPSGNYSTPGSTNRIELGPVGGR